jgi:trk system potassium uptake protein TrkH
MHTERSFSHRLLSAVRILVAAAAAVAVLPAISTPDGYLGARDVVTAFGRIYTVGLAPMAVLSAWAELTDRPWGRWLVSAILSVNVTVFVPALPDDPVLTTFIVLWQLVALGAHLLDEGNVVQLRSNTRRSRRGDQWYREYGPAARHLTTASILLILSVVGYGVSDRLIALGICSGTGVLALAAVSRFLWILLTEGHRAVPLVYAPLVLVGFSGPDVAAVLSALAVSNALCLLVFAARSPLFDELLADFFDYPALLILTSFGLVILLGTVLLTLPAASTAPGSISPIDALFTSTSATCVTGLIVLDTPHAFTGFGQGVILALIQVGGLGITVLSTFGAVLLGRGLGLRGEQAMGDLLEIGGSRDAYRLTRFIVATTVAVEALGTVILTQRYWQGGTAFAEAAWNGVFHAVSAFCNAGFALQSDSLVMFQKDPVVLATVSTLVLLGGIGFVVIATFWSWGDSPSRSKFGVHAKLALWTTGLLLASGTVLYAAFEWSATLGDMTWGDRVWNAFFQSVTLRTAGFNTVDFGALQDSTLMLMVVFMFIGASPGSAGGGAKTTTIAVLWGLVRGMARGETRVVFFDRRVPQAVVYKAGAIVAMYLGAVVVGFLILATVEDIGFVPLFFETVSALGTVGLSIGATGELQAEGKLVVSALMFLGRTGPLTLVVAFMGRHASNLEYSETDIMVG